MLVFIDDSGDVGYKFRQGSSTHLVFLACVFETESAATETARALIEFKNKIGKPANSEFKFAKMAPKTRLAFLNDTADLDFSIIAMLIDKRTSPRTHLTFGTMTLQNRAIELFITHFKNQLAEASIRIDGQSSNKDILQLKSKLLKLKNFDGNRSVKDIKFVNSKHSKLIQLADVYAGTLRRIATEQDLVLARVVIKSAKISRSALLVLK